MKIDSVYYYYNVSIWLLPFRLAFIFDLCIVFVYFLVFGMFDSKYYAEIWLKSLDYARIRNLDCLQSSILRLPIYVEHVIPFFMVLKLK